MRVFSRKKSVLSFPPFDLSEWTPAIRSSICTGEKTAGMKNISEFCRAYGVSPDRIETIY